MTDISRRTGGTFPPVEDLVTHDSSMTGAGTTQNPLAIARTVTAQIRVTARTDNVGNITYSSSVINLGGGITYGGLDESLIPSIGYLKVILTLPKEIADQNKVPIPGIHFPTLPPGPLGETVFLAVPPIPLQGVDNTDASMLIPIFGKGIDNTDEIIDVTYDLAIVSRG